MSQAPRVAAIVVAHNPGEYFSECLGSLAASNYPNLEVVVVDDASDRDLQEEVRGSLPTADYLRIEDKGGFAQACNLAAGQVQDASHLLFLHDDVALAPEAISAMMEVAFSKNAGIVTPKVMVWDSPHQILQFGMDIDKTAAVAARVDVGDLDQSQYDAVKEVSVAPGGATLVRSDLFVALGGFDPTMFLYGEDIDLSLRAHGVGAKVFTAPLARVRHKMVSTLNAPKHKELRKTLRDDTPERAGVGHYRRLSLTRRHQLRIIWKDFLGRGRQRALVRFFVVSLLESVYYLLTGRPRLSSAVLGAFRWNFGHRRDLRESRRSLKAMAGDQGDAIVFIGGSARFSAYFASQRSLRRLRHEGLIPEVPGPSLHPAPSGAMAGGERLELLVSQVSKAYLWVVAAGATYAIWTVIFGPLPFLGTLAPIPAPFVLLHSYLSGTFAASNFGGSPAPSALLILSVLGTLVLGQVGFLEHLLILASMAGGSLGMYRLTRRQGSATAGRFAAATYLVLPLIGHEFSGARFFEILAFGLAPWLVLSFHFASESQRASRRVRRRANLGLGMVAGLALAVSPPLFVAFVIYGLFHSLLSLIKLARGDSRRGFTSLLVAIMVAAAINLPWSATLVNPSVGIGRTLGEVAPQGLSFLQIVTFSTDISFGASTLSLGIVLILLAALAFSKAPRTLSIGSQLVGFMFFVALACMDSAGLFGGSPLALWALLELAAIQLCQGVGLAFDAMVIDLPRFRFGGRHVLALLSSLVFAVSSLNLVRGFANDRLGLPSSGFESSLAYLGKLGPDQSVLWLGDPNVMPVQGWKLTNGLSVGVVGQLLPDIRSEYSPGSFGGSSRVVSALRAAIGGETVQLGARLAQFGIKYVVVPQPTSSPGYFVGTDLDLIFERQVDLKQLLVDPSIVAFRVTPKVRSFSAPTTSRSMDLRILGLLFQLFSVVTLTYAIIRRRSFLTTFTLDRLRGREGSYGRPIEVTLPQSPSQVEQSLPETTKDGPEGQEMDA